MRETNCYNNLDEISQFIGRSNLIVPRKFCHAGRCFAYRRPGPSVEMNSKCDIDSHASYQPGCTGKILSVYNCQRIARSMWILKNGRALGFGSAQNELLSWGRREIKSNCTVSCEPGITATTFHPGGPSWRGEY